MLICVSPVRAQSIDETYSYFTVGRDTNGYTIPDKQIKADFFISWQQLAYIVKAKEEETGDYREPIRYSENAFDNELRNVMDRNDLFEAYLSEHVSVSQEDTPCSLRFVPLPDQDRRQILIGRGVHISGFFDCPQRIETIEVTNTILDDVTLYQRNFIVLQNSETKVAEHRFMKDTGTVSTSFRVPKGTLAPKQPEADHLQSFVPLWPAVVIGGLGGIVLLRYFLQQMKQRRRHKEVHE